MGFLIKVAKGKVAKEIDMLETCTRSVKFTVDIPQDSDARTKDISVTMVIKGRILTGIADQAVDVTGGITNWSTTAAENVDCYRDITVMLITAGVVERRYHFVNAFIIDYKEEFNNNDGSGLFTLVLKQKKDLLNKATIKGGYKKD